MENIMLRKGLIFGIIILFVGINTIVPIEGLKDKSRTIIYVPDDYPTIQAAVENASDDDTIIVRDGTYTENVDVNKRLTIQSENGSDFTIVQATDPDDHVFEITADEVTLTEFTIMLDEDYPPSSYAGILGTPKPLQ